MVQLGPRLKTPKYWHMTILWYSQDTKYSSITCTIENIQNCSISWMIHQTFLKISIKYVPSLDKDKDISPEYCWCFSIPLDATTYISHAWYSFNFPPWVLCPLLTWFFSSWRKLCCQAPTGITQTHVVEGGNTHA